MCRSDHSCKVFTTGQQYHVTPQADQINRHTPSVAIGYLNAKQRIGRNQLRPAAAITFVPCLLSRLQLSLPALAAVGPQILIALRSTFCSLQSEMGVLAD
jgi:hypothetical protein